MLLEAAVHCCSARTCVPTPHLSPPLHKEQQKEKRSTDPTEHWGGGAANGVHQQQQQQQSLCTSTSPANQLSCHPILASLAIVPVTWPRNGGDWESAMLQDHVACGCLSLTAVSRKWCSMRLPNPLSNTPAPVRCMVLSCAAAHAANMPQPDLLHCRASCWLPLVLDPRRLVDAHNS
jgi:hypothetical protein